jgi:hypothetical protein
MKIVRIRVKIGAEIIFRFFFGVFFCVSVGVSMGGEAVEVWIAGSYVDGVDGTLNEHGSGRYKNRACSELN